MIPDRSCPQDQEHEDGEVEVFMESLQSILQKKDGVATAVGSEEGTNRVDMRGEQDADDGFEGDDENGVGSDNDFVVNVSFCSNREVDVLNDLIRGAKSIRETVVTFETAMDEIRQRNVIEIEVNESGSNYYIQIDYMKDLTCKWSIGDDDETVDDNVGDGTGVE
ncbi:hypothetical protein ACFE04_011214 [Oxalis oulophora]